MVKKISIIDNNIGNLASVLQACRHFGADAELTSRKQDLVDAHALILPGVGSYPEAMARLRATNLDRVIVDRINAGVPFLGICLGLQLLFTESEEFEVCPGLGVIRGTVRRLADRVTKEGLHVPFMGWNACLPVARSWNGTPLQGLEGRNFYLVHSFYVEPDEPDCVLGVSRYGSFEYCTCVQRENIFATQFHPEKSGLAGLALLRTWLAGV